MSAYLSPAEIAKLANLELVARMVVAGSRTGHHKSPGHGFNVEFTEHRPYLPGDELRHIDWKHFAKTDEFFVKQYEESTSLACLVALDHSRSMAFGGGPLGKLAYSRYLAAALAYVLVHQQDAVGLALFSDALDTVVEPRSNPAHLHRILATVEADPGAERTDFPRVLEGLATQLKRRHLVILVSDFLGDPAQILHGVRQLRFLRHEVLLLQVLSPEELDFPYEGLVCFDDLEAPGERLTLDTSSLRVRYQEEFQRFREELIQGARAMKVDIELFRTDRPMEEGLARFLWGRTRGSPA